MLLLCSQKTLVLTAAMASALPDQLGLQTFSAIFPEHSEKILTKPNHNFGILKRTYHFVTDQKRMRVLYLASVHKHGGHVVLHVLQHVVQQSTKF